ncbi:hypothetical protein [Streptomyces sp. NRRL B-3229]|uniref:hypothetical protein n=1 Tax=Streptomyces sp. NRRL B-3229 TaxID=1463836 RepID=UPI0004C28DDF|nr:hypothetical protein [Streptomyces sp. NRRL B-3229]
MTIAAEACSLLVHGSATLKLLTEVAIRGEPEERARAESAASGIPAPDLLGRHIAATTERAAIPMQPQPVTVDRAKK